MVGLPAKIQLANLNKNLTEAAHQGYIAQYTQYLGNLVDEVAGLGADHALATCYNAS